jgi:NitT/TauT family transport system ATP-binding protein
VIELEGLRVSFAVERGRERTVTHALGPLTLAIPDLQFVSVLGRSGSGKTTLLRLLAGLLEPSDGTIVVDGRPLRGPGPDRAVVFQSAALYPWRTVRANVRLGLELGGKVSRSEADTIVDEQLERVCLTAFADHYPSQLSGGMQQRVGLARALAVSPRRLLMDEPFGAVDAILRRELGAMLLALWEQERRTVVFVTHSVAEALTLSDRVVVLRDGRVVEDVAVGLPRPRDPDDTEDDVEFRRLRHVLLAAL